MRGATRGSISSRRSRTVSIHAPRAGRDPRASRLQSCRLCFNPRAPCGARPSIFATIPISRLFQSTRPMRGATLSVRPRSSNLPVSIHAPHAGRDLIKDRLYRSVNVSIHAPHAGRDAGQRAPAATYYVVSIHAPHAGRDCLNYDHKRLRHGFNPRAPCGARPTLSLRSSSRRRFNPRAPCGARQFSAPPYSSVACFNPRAPCGARHDSFCHECYMTVFQSTRPMRGATRRFYHHFANKQFQSTRPMRGATEVYLWSHSYLPVSIHAPHAGRDLWSQLYLLDRGVSIHAPHAGRDARLQSAGAQKAGFNPRAPCGARPPPAQLRPPCPGFNPRAPCGARQSCPARVKRRIGFNPRAPCGARRCAKFVEYITDVSFNPRAPCGARPIIKQGIQTYSRFQSTRPMRGATSRAYSYQRAACFNPRAPCGARPVWMDSDDSSLRFQSTRPMRGATYNETLSTVFSKFQSTRPMRGATSRIANALYAP